MSPQFQWPTPQWLRDLPDVEQKAALTRFHLCLATAYACDKASPAELSRLLGMSDSAINQMKNRGTVAAEQAIALERLLGRQLFPRELFRPDLFVLPE
jgi:hypothetical protein